MYKKRNVVKNRVISPAATSYQKMHELVFSACKIILIYKCILFYLSLRCWWARMAFTLSMYIITLSYLFLKKKLLQISPAHLHTLSYMNMLIHVNTLHSHKVSVLCVSTTLSKHQLNAQSLYSITRTVVCVCVCKREFEMSSILNSPKCLSLSLSPWSQSERKAIQTDFISPQPAAEV